MKRREEPSCCSVKIQHNGVRADRHYASWVGNVQRPFAGPESHALALRAASPHTCAADP